MQRQQQRRPREPVVQAVPKDENARVVTVFGDSLASGLGQRAWSPPSRKEKSVRVETKFKELVRPWRAMIITTGQLRSRRISTIPPPRTDVAVMLIGMNDRQEIQAGNYSFRSDGWVREYEARIARVARLFRERGIPLVWVGIPPMKSESLSADVLFFNQLYRNKCRS
jgi:hypothetical protein